MLMRELRLDDTELALFCTFTTFGTARDLTRPQTRPATDRLVQQLRQGRRPPVTARRTGPRSQTAT